MSQSEAQSAGPTRHHPIAALPGGTLIGVLGGLIGLGGAEFRLPLLIWFYRFGTLEAVILNKAMSLIVVAFALPFRSTAVPLAHVAQEWLVIVNILAGSLAGAWVGAGWATQLRTEMLSRIIAGLLLFIALALLAGHGIEGGTPHAQGALQIVLCVVAGFGIGIAASLMGVAGGELLIPTLILICGYDAMVAGSLSLAISLPTMLVGLSRYARDRSFRVLGTHWRFVLGMAAGSIVGAFIGAMMLDFVPLGFLPPLLALILVISAGKLWMHSTQKA